jgi:hypothetical protein
MQTHGKIAGHIKPERHIVFLTGRRIALRQLIEKGPGFDETKEIGLNTSLAASM